MSLLEAILLGIVQGLTEFLPISSSGHLILVPWLFNMEYLRSHPEFNKTFDVALHFGTLTGVIAYFRVEVADLFRGLHTLIKQQKIVDSNSRLTFIIAVATVPAAAIGAVGESFIDSRLGQPWQIAIFLIIFAFVLAWADKQPENKTIEDVDGKSALKIGFAQAVALAPGVSRSGITISAGRTLGLDRNSAARLSFLLLIPVVAGATLVKGLGVLKDGLPSGSAEPMVAGVIAAAISSYITIAWMLAFVRKRSYKAFVSYRVVLGIGVFTLIATGVRTATF